MFNSTDYDVMVLRAGVAGLPATLFTGAMELRTLVLQAGAHYMILRSIRRDIKLLFQRTSPTLISENA
jgi:hypothetical protein